MRVRSLVVVGAVSVLASGLVATSCGDDGPGETAEFCAAVQANTAALTTPPAALEDVDDFVELYRRIGETAPLAIEPHWQALVLNYETVSTVEPNDPESVQRALAQVYATEESAVAVRDFLITRCNVDIGPVTTIVPRGPVPIGTVPATTAGG